MHSFDALVLLTGLRLETLILSYVAIYLLYEYFSKTFS